MTLNRLFRTFLDYLRTPPAAESAKIHDEIREEIEFHLTSSFQENQNAGFDYQDSEKLALQRFGDVSSVVKQCSNIASTRSKLVHRIHVIATTGLVLAVGFLGWSVIRNIDQDPIRNLTATGYTFEETSGDITGSVSNNVGSVIRNAQVLAVVKTWPPNGYRQQLYMTSTTDDGSFEIPDVYAPEHNYEVSISVIADGHLLNSKYQDMTKGNLAPFEFQVRKTEQFELKFESSEGQPLEGVCAFPCGRTELDGTSHVVYFSNNSPIVQRSNLAGKVSMPHFLPGEKAMFYVRFPDHEWETKEFTVPHANQIVVVTPEIAN